MQLSDPYKHRKAKARITNIITVVVLRFYFHRDQWFEFLYISQYHACIVNILFQSIYINAYNIKGG